MRRLALSNADKDACEVAGIAAVQVLTYNILLLEIIRCGLQICTICSCGRHLDMLQTTRRICLCLRLDCGIRKISLALSKGYL